MIPEHKIEEVLERIDLVNLVGRYVELKKAGRSYKGRCPFHQEKSASFHVTPEMRRFKCFGCQAGGDAIAFVQRYLGKSFVDAIRDLAREAGVELEATEDPAQKERARIKEATQFAQTHFQERLWDERVGKGARAYLESRGITEATSRAFGLGFAPDAWSDLSDRLRVAGILDFASQAGLAQPRKSGEGFYDTFRNRLMVPIRAPEGRTIAFGGRLLGGEGPKYLNSRESKLYNKSETLYGMDLARDEIRRLASAVLVEGYFDCIGLHQVGVKHAVALCSTALTSGHLAALTRAEAKELVLLLDGDDAGRKAVERLALPILASGTAAKVALLPEGEDPDTFARKVGLAGVQALLQGASTLTQHLFRSVLPGGKESSFEEKMQALERLRPIAAGLPVGLTRSAFFGAMAQAFGLPAAELEAALRGKTPPVRPAPKAAAPAAPPARPVVERAPEPLEALFVALVLKQPALLRKDLFRLQDELAHPGLRSVLAQVGGGTDPDEVLAEASETLKRALSQAKTQLPRDESGEEGAFFQVSRMLKLRRIDEQLSHIAKLTGQESGGGDLTEEIRRLQGERIELLALKKRVLAELPDGGNKPQG